MYLAFLTRHGNFTAYTAGMYDWSQPLSFPGISLCIRPELVCNGENDCGSWEDEDPAMCERCPKVFGYPQRNDIWSASHKCYHNETGRPICTVACDGMNDRCKGWSDVWWF